MILAFLLLFIILILFFQQWSLENSLDSIEGDFWPEENVVNPEESFDITIELTNKQRLPLYYVKIRSSFAKEIQIESPKREQNGHAVTLSTWLKSKEQVQIKIPVSPTQRGRYMLLSPSLYLGDFLGLKEREKKLDQFREVVVAPKEVSNPEVKQILGKFLGDYSVRRFIYEDPILTLGYREYTGREPMKMIAWKQSAQRQQTLMVKEYDHTVEPVISVLVNVEMNDGDVKELLEKCFSLARSVCSNLEARGISYDFYINAQMAGGTGNDHVVNEGLGTRHFTKVMELLGRSLYTPALSYPKLLELAETSGGKDRGKIVITPNDDVAAFSSEHQVLVLCANLL